MRNGRIKQRTHRFEILLERYKGVAITFPVQSIQRRITHGLAYSVGKESIVSF